MNNHPYLDLPLRTLEELEEQLTMEYGLLAHRAHTDPEIVDSLQLPEMGRVAKRLGQVRDELRERSR